MVAVTQTLSIKDMSFITGSSLHSPVQQYALIDRKTAASGYAQEKTRVDSVRKSFGFRWKGLGIEYQSQDIHVASPASTSRKFISDMLEAREIKTLANVNNQSHYGPLEPRAAAAAYSSQWQAPLQYQPPMLNLSV